MGVNTPTCKVVRSGESYVGRQGLTYFGEQLENVAVAKAGEYVCIPPGVPHLVINGSSAVCRALVAHTASDDQAGIVLLPELDSLI